MSAALAYVFNERTTCWRTQTPGVADAGDSTITSWCYSPQRGAVTWSQDGDGSAPDLYCNADDDDLESQIPGATLQTYPQVPDGDAVALKRFHEVSLTVSNFDSSASSMAFTISFGAVGAGETTVLCTSLNGNEVAPTGGVPELAQCRVMVPRACHVSGHLVINMSPDNLTTRWRLHAIDVMWQPESPRSLNR